MVWLKNLGFADPHGTTSRAVDALFAGAVRDLGNGLQVVRVGDEDGRLLSAVITCQATDGRVRHDGDCARPVAQLGLRAARRERGVEPYKPLAAPPSPQRLRWFRWLVSYSAYFTLARNGLYALVDAADPAQALAAAVTGPPGAIPYGRMSGGDMGDWCQKAGMEMAIEVLRDLAEEAKQRCPDAAALALGCGGDDDDFEM